MDGRYGFDKSPSSPSEGAEASGSPELIQSNSFDTFAAAESSRLPRLSCLFPGGGAATFAPMSSRLSSDEKPPMSAEEIPVLSLDNEDGVLGLPWGRAAASIGAATTSAEEEEEEEEEEAAIARSR